MPRHRPRTLRVRPAQASRDGNARRWVEHLGLITSAAALLLVVLLVLSAARFDVATATAIASYSSTSVVSVATLAIFVPVLTMVALFAVIAVQILDRPLGAPVRRGSYAVVNALRVLLAAMTPWPVWLGFMLFSFIPILVDGHARRRGSLPPRLLPVYGLAVFFSGLSLVLVVSAGPVWLPPERLVLEGGTATTGYVLASEDDELVVLWARDRRVERIAADAVQDRQVCRGQADDKPPWSSPTPVAALARLERAEYHSCPSGNGEA